MVTRRGRGKTVCARGAWVALVGGPSTSPLGDGRPFMRTHWVLAALSVLAIGVIAGTPQSATAPGGDDLSSLIGTWRLVIADDRPDENSQWQHSYGNHPKGYLVYDDTGHMFVQFCNDPLTPPFKAGDFKPTAREAKTAYLNYVSVLRYVHC